MTDTEEIYLMLDMARLDSKKAEIFKNPEGKIILFYSKDRITLSSSAIEETREITELQAKQIENFATMHNIEKITYNL